LPGLAGRWTLTGAAATISAAVLWRQRS
jgi:hypothetical protein